MKVQIVFQLTEIGQHLGEFPLGVAPSGPVVVVLRNAPEEHLPIDGAGAADAPAPSQWVSPDDTLREAASRLIWEAGDSLAVVEEGRVTAEIRAEDIWRTGARGAP